MTFICASCMYVAFFNYHSQFYVHLEPNLFFLGHFKFQSFEGRNFGNVLMIIYKTRYYNTCNNDHTVNRQGFSPFKVRLKRYVLW